MTTPHMYDGLAPWWPLLSSPAEYEEEASWYSGVLHGLCATRPRTLLELGSGGGNNASYMKRRFDEIVLVDRAPAMLEVSRALNPECRHVEGDMRTVRLEETFDCVFVHDALSYLTTRADIAAVLETVRVHCRPGGGVVLVPDHVRETFRPSTGRGGHDADDGRALRYLEWSWDPDPDDETIRVDYAIMVRDAGGAISVTHDTHVEGLFGTHVWRDLMHEAGFDAHVVPFAHTEVETPITVFAGTR